MAKKITKKEAIELVKSDPKSISTSALLRSTGSIIVPKDLTHSLGLLESIIYTELCSRQEYFKDKDALTEDGYFYNTQYSLQAATSIGEKGQRSALTKLKKMGLIDFKLKGMPSKRYFKVIDDNELILGLLAKGNEILKAFENPSDTSKGRSMKRRREVREHFQGSANNTNPLNNPYYNTEFTPTCVDALSVENPKTPYKEGDDALVDKFRRVYRKEFGKPHRKFYGDYTAISEYEGSEDYLEDAIYEFFAQEKFDPDKCTLDYFLKVIGRFR